MRLVILSICIMALSCSGASHEEVQKPVSEPVVVPVEQLTPEQQKFIIVYNKIACRANYNYDPDSTFGAIREPVSYLKKLTDDESSLLGGYVKIVTENGYADLNEFFIAAKKIRDDIAFWKKFEPGFIERLGACKDK